MIKNKMAKAQNKKVEVKEVLDIKKRSDLFIEAYQKFEKEMSELYGMRIATMLTYSQQGIIPRLTVVDLLNTNENTNTEKPEATS